MVAVDDRPMNSDMAANNISLVSTSAELYFRFIKDALSLDKNLTSNKSMVSEGALSRLSQFTSCTNPAFDAVHREWRLVNILFYFSWC